jgi:cytochrome oxidase Cu insertion factor (SCO1/SenC/PrrC family)
MAVQAGAHERDAGLRGVDPAELGFTYGIGRFTPEYVPPAPGTYALPVIDSVADHAVVDVRGRPTTLRTVIGGRLAVVAFVYTSCNEAAGCPVSMSVLRALDRAIAADRDLVKRVTLVTVSFDPERDTPAHLAAVRRLHRPASDWQFVTTRGDDELQPILADFDQPVAKLRYPDGNWTGLFRHVLKVFLVDAESRVRNVYSVGLLNPTLVLNDVRTLLLSPPARASTGDAAIP